MSGLPRIAELSSDKEQGNRNPHYHHSDFQSEPDVSRRIVSLRHQDTSYKKQSSEYDNPNRKETPCNQTDSAKEVLNGFCRSHN